MTSFSDDDRGNVTADQRAVKDLVFVTRYKYNLFNNFTQMIFSSGRIVHYAQDSHMLLGVATVDVEGSNARFLSMTLAAIQSVVHPVND